MSENIYCGRCGDGPFAGEHGLRSHTSNKHRGADPLPQCCVADTGTLPSGRRYCLDCGRVLEGTDDARVTGGASA